MGVSSTGAVRVAPALLMRTSRAPSEEEFRMTWTAASMEVLEQTSRDKVVILGREEREEEIFETSRAEAKTWKPSC